MKAFVSSANTNDNCNTIIKTSILFSNKACMNRDYRRLLPECRGLMTICAHPYAKKNLKRERDMHIVAVT